MRQSLISCSSTIAGFVLLLGISQLAYGAMYKWVDEEGITHYTQQPPPDGIEAENIKPPPVVDTDTASENLEKQQNQVEKLRKGREKSAEQRHDKEQEAKIKAENCSRARSRLQQASRPRVAFTNPDGSVRRASEDERQKTINEANKQIEEFCN